MSADNQAVSKITQDNVPIQKSVAFYAALCLFLSALEYLIPKPLPFMRLGLANLPLILALFKFSVPSYFLLIVLKIICQAYISGTFFSYIFVFSLCGTFASGLSMLMLFRLCKKYISPVGLSLCGSLANSVMQLFLTRLMLFKDSIKFVAPVLLISGFVTGFFIGFVAAVFIKKSTWFSSETFCVNQKNNTSLPKIQETAGHTVTEKKPVFTENMQKTAGAAKSVMILFVFFVLLTFFVLQTDYRISVIMCVVFFVFHAVQCRFLHKKFPKFFVSLCVILSVVFFSLLSPYGKVLFNLGKFPVTYGALTSGLKRGCTVCGTVYLSKILLNFNWKPSGKTGTFVAQVLAYFSYFSSVKASVHLKTFFSDLDCLLLSMPQ